MYLNFFVTYVLDPTRHSAWGHAVTDRAAVQHEFVQILLFTGPHPKAPGPIRLVPRVRCEL